jgi:hypothetical protein
MPDSLAALLLDVWDSAANEVVPRRALMLLSALRPDLDDDALLELTPAQVDSLLIAGRRLLFGSGVEAVSTCPACGELAEVSFALDDILPDQATTPSPPLQVARNVREVRFRLPHLADLLEIVGTLDPEAARQALATRCVLTDTAPQAGLDDDLLLDLSAWMATADPGAEIDLHMTCPSCKHVWLEPFVIADFLWRELAAWASALLRDVHTLATTYGWFERDILQLSPRRRRMYVEMATA